MKIQLLRKAYADVTAAQAELAQPDVWGGIQIRTSHPRSPHRETLDCWLRYNSFKNWTGDIDAFNAPHKAEWYPIADRLPACKRLAVRVAMDFKADRLGFVLATKIPAGKQVYPHVDNGWHARFYEKYCVQIKGAAEQKFHVEDESLSTESGDLFTFDNAHPHWVTNPTGEDRISLIVCIHRSS